MARQRTRLQKISFVTSGALALLEVAGLSASMGNAACLLNALFEIPLRAEAGAISAVIFATWQFLVPCLMGHMRLLECVVHLTTCGLQIFLAFTGVG